MPNTVRWMSERGVDPQRDLLDVGIAFQCLNGGVRMVGTGARTTLPGAHVIGELAGGVRGPDRPGGNSLAEGQVFGHRAGTAAARDALQDRGPPAARSRRCRSRGCAGHCSPTATLDAAPLSRALRDSLQRHALVEKNEAGLQSAIGLAREVGTALEAGGNATPSGAARGPHAAQHGDHGPDHSRGLPGTPRDPQRPLPHRLPRSRRRPLRHGLGLAPTGRGRSTPRCRLPRRVLSP